MFVYPSAIPAVAGMSADMLQGRNEIHRLCTSVSSRELFGVVLFQGSHARDCDFLCTSVDENSLLKKEKGEGDSSADGKKSIHRFPCISSYGMQNGIVLVVFQNECRVVHSLS